MKIININVTMRYLETSPGVLVIRPAPDSKESPALPGQSQPSPGVGEGRQTVPLLTNIIKHLDT